MTRYGHIKRLGLRRRIGHDLANFDLLVTNLHLS